ncbi:metal-sulfur cluster assembly factor [Amycolatopsis sp. GM8]|uniref:metal-sulfur cluster assembly factor n=1 Tax=Amycolatopsis sp. GM8 TaxID=2896530 RepID=UPI001F3AE552|nr:iron-sulfur cluster assembly protein [Amycolatopsis sp. GM8]
MNFDESAVVDLAERVRAQVGQVVDPCGRTNGTGLTLGELGMVDSVDVGTDGVATVRLLLDDPVCLYSVPIRAEVATAARSVAGVTEVRIEHSTDRLWDPDRLSPEAAAKIEAWQADRASRFAGVNPRVALALLPLSRPRRAAGANPADRP